MYISNFRKFTPRKIPGWLFEVLQQIQQGTFQQLKEGSIYIASEYPQYLRETSSLLRTNQILEKFPTKRQQIEFMYPLSATVVILEVMKKVHVMKS